MSSKKEDDEQSGNMYNFNDEGSNSNQPPKQSAIRRSLGDEDNSYKYNQNENDEQNVIENGEQNAIRRSLGDKNPNANEFPNYVEKSSEQRFPNLQESHSPFEMHPPVFKQFQQEVIQRPPPRQPKQFYLINYLMIGLLQIIFIILIGICYENDDKNENFGFLYNFFKDVHLMIFIGFGLLYTALKDHQWSSIGIILFIGTISFEISFIWNHIWDNAFRYSLDFDIPESNNNNSTNWEKKDLNFDTLTKIDYFTGSVFVSLGALIGKLSMCQYVIISLYETFFSSLNYYICFKLMGGIDNGGSLYIHTFGAIFGIAISISAFCTKKEYKKISYNPHLTSDYYSNIFSLIGSLFLWLFFPSFNTSFIQSLSTEKVKQILRYRGIINTYLSMIGSVISVFVVSPIVSNGKIKMEHLLNSSFIGGIIIGGCCTICSSSWAAILIGFIGGSISVLGFWFFKKKLKELKLEDTFGILYTFGIPGILGGFLNSIFMASLEKTFKNTNFLQAYFNFKLKTENNNVGRDIGYQIGIEIAIIFITIGLAGFSGMTIGLIIRTTKCEKNEIYFVDSENYVEEESIPLPEWKHPRQDDINLNSSGNKL